MLTVLKTINVDVYCCYIHHILNLHSF